MPLGQQYGTSGIRQGGMGVSGTYGGGFTSGFSGQRSGVGIGGYGTSSFGGIAQPPPGYLQQAAAGRQAQSMTAQYNADLTQQQGYYDQAIADQAQGYQQVVDTLQQQYTQPTQSAPPAPVRPETFYIPSIGAVPYNELNNIPAQWLQLGFKGGKQGRAYMPDGRVIPIGSYNDLSQFYG